MADRDRASSIDSAKLEAECLPAARREKLDAAFDGATEKAQRHNEFRR